MVDFDSQYLIDGYLEYQSVTAVNIASQYLSSGLEGGGSSTIIYYMRGKDVDCGILTYRYWTSLNAPDPNGLSYTGPKCGASPISDITIISIKISNV